MAESPARWLILVHQLPPTPSNVRVRVWRRLQQVGAVVLRNSLYVLPDTEETREDFNWVREEIEASGGQVSVLAAAAIDGFTEAELVQQFRAQRTADYETLAADVRKAGERTAAARRLAPASRLRQLRVLRERFAAIQTRDYFDAAGRALVEQALRDLQTSGESSTRGASRSRRLRPLDFRRRTWVTRSRPGIDRMASAWLIRRFIAPDARFAFVDSGQPVRDGHVPFDMPRVEFGHHGARCTFETLMHRFGIEDPAAVALSRVVHDLDLKDARFGMPETAAVGRVVEGLRIVHGGKDGRLLEHGIHLMEALYQSFLAESTRARRRRR